VGIFLYVDSKNSLIANFIHRPGGAGRLEAYLAKAISLLSHTSILIAPAEPHPTNERIMKGCKNIRLYVLKPRARYHKIGVLERLMVDYLTMENRIAKLLFREKPDIVIASGGISKNLTNIAHSLRSRVLVYYHKITPWYAEIRGFYRKYKWSDLSMLYLSRHVE
jgi:hypothetical protein